MRRQDGGRIVLVFGLLVLAVVIGTLLEVVELEEGKPTPWEEPSISTETPEPMTETPGWWDAKGTPPPWPTGSVETESTVED